MPFNPKMNMGGLTGGAGNPVRPTPPPLPKKAETDSAGKALAEALDSANRQNTELQERIQQLTDELEGKETELRAIQAKLEARPEPAKDDELANALEARKAAEDVIDRLEREISELKARGNQTANLQKELDEAKLRITELEATPVAKSDDTYDHLIAEREKVEEECRRLQNELDAERAKCAELQNDLDALRTQCSILQKSQWESAKTNADSAQTIQDLEETIHRIQVEKSRLNQEIRQLKAVPTTPFPDEDNSACNQAVQDLNQKVHKLNEELQKAYERGRHLESTIKIEQSTWVQAQEARKQAENIANALNAFLNSIDPEPKSDLSKRNDRIEYMIRSRKAKVDAKNEGSSGKRNIAKIVFLVMLVLVAVIAVIMSGLAGLSVEKNANPDSKQTPVAPSEGASTVTPSTEEPTPAAAVTTYVIPKANAEPEPSTPSETCYPANTRSILALLNQKSKDTTVFGKAVINAPKGQKRITCDEAPVFENGRTDLSGCEICVPYGPGKYPADQEHVKAILGRDDPKCYDYRSLSFFSEWSVQTIHLDCKDKPDYFTPADCRDITDCEIVVTDPNKIACDTCTD